MTPLAAAPSPPPPSPPALVALVAPSAPAPSGRAELPPATPQDLTFAADELEADPAARSVTLRGGVTVGYGRYRLTAKSLRLTFTKDAIVFDGEARLAFCPCASPPITIAARAGRLSAPGDLVLRLPRLELFGFPVFALPALWARAPSEPGLLPPFIALRGDDGLLVGAGVHLPFRGENAEDGRARVLDLTAGGYLKGGASLGVTLDTPTSSARLTADFIHGERLAIEARGAEAKGPSAALAWEADVIRGDRARSGTVELTPAAAPFDHAAFEASLRTEGHGLTARPGALVAAGLLARAGRGEGPWILGPTARAAMSGPLGVTSSHAALGAFGASAEGLVLGDATGGLALPIGHASTWVELDQKAGPIALSLRGGGSLLAAGAAPPLTPLTPPTPPTPPRPSEGAPRPPFEASSGAAPAFDARAGARLRAELPLVRAFTARPAEAPLVHWVAPTLEASFLASASRGAFLEPLVPLSDAGTERLPTGPSVPGLLPRPFEALAAGGISTAIGRYAGPAARLDLRAGALARPDAPIAALASARLEASAPTALASVALALTSSRDPAASSAAAAGPGLALTARARLGAPEAFGAALDLAANTGPDAREARGLDDPEGAALGASPAFFRGEGTTLGLALFAPVFASIRASLRADADLTHAALLAVRGAAAYRNPCGCFALALDAARRLGRGGVDVSLALSLTPPAR